MKKQANNIDKYGWIFISVGSILIILLYFIPMIISFLTSFKSGMGMNLQYSGLKNYIRLLHDEVFIQAVKNTATFLIIQVPIMILLALVIAVMLNDPKLKFKGVFRTAIFLPCITSLVAYSVLFKSLFAPDGIVNSVLMSMHVISDPIMWITDPFYAKVLIIIALTWRWTGYNMIFYLAGLQNIDKSVYEAAKIDGASEFHTFVGITIPLLKPVILFTTIMSTAGTLQVFDEVMNLTKGGPANETLSISMYIYNLSFKYTPNFGYAATVSFSILIMIAILTVIQFKVAGNDNTKSKG